MNAVKPEDFNVSPTIADKEWVYQQGVDVYRANAACMDVGQCKDFSIGIFLLKDGCGLPLHDHPGMHGCMYALCVKYTVVDISVYTDCECSTVL